MSSQHNNNMLCPSPQRGPLHSGSLSSLEATDAGCSSEAEEVTTHLLAALSSNCEEAVRSSVGAPLEVAPSSGGSYTNDPDRTSQSSELRQSLPGPASHLPRSMSDRTPPRPRSLSRRRGGGSTSSSTSSKRLTSSRIPSTPSTISTTTATSSTTASTSRRNRTNNSTVGSRSETIDEESFGLRSSLDAGMARVRRWIRSKSSTRPSRSPISAPAINSNMWNHTLGSVAMSFSADLEGYQDDDLIDHSSRYDDFAASSTSSVMDDFGRQSRMQRLPTQTPTIVEETVDVQVGRAGRQRALSETDAVRFRDLLFHRALSAPNRGFRRRVNSQAPPHFFPLRQRPRGDGMELAATSGPVPATSQLSSSAAEVLYASTRSMRSNTDRSIELGEVEGMPAEITTMAPSAQDDAAANGVETPGQSDEDPDPQRRARARWIRINRRFQVVITIVALVFSLLLFAILVSWVVLTSAYVVSIDKTCDVPLKLYYWLVTLQLIMDVFRTDIMRLIFRWDANSNQRIPCRVITYNAGYLTYALVVLRMGIRSVFLDSDATCRASAPELFQSSAAFVSLSIAAWSTIVLGYLAPFCVVATLLTLNGYSPSSDSQRDGSSPFTVFPTVMGAPPGCVDRLPIVTLEEFPAHYPMECCICMENFTGTDVIVETECQHVFHKQCCRDWLRQARTCPVCRTDIPGTLEDLDGPESRQYQSAERPGFGPASRPFARNNIHHEVVSLLQILRRRDRRQRRNESPDGGVRSTEGRDTGSRSQNSSVHLRDVSSSLEEGRSVRQYGQQ